MDTRTNDILKQLKDLNELFDDTEDAGSCGYFNIHDYKKSK